MPATKVVRTTVVRTSSSRTTSFNEVWIWAVLIACLALIFAIISIATSGWGGRNLLKDGSNHLSTIVFAFLAIISLILGIIFIVLFAKRLITSFSKTVKLSGVFLLALGGIFIVIAYMSYSPYFSSNYSYYLMVTAGILAFISSIFTAFWLGRYWITV